MNLRVSPNSKHLDAIHQILAQACTNQTKQDQAFHAIDEAIDLYRQTYPLHDGSALMRSGISASRKELDSVLKTLRKLKQQMEDLSPETISMLGHINEMSVGQTKQLLENFSSAILASKEFADTQPDKGIDTHRAVLAFSIARALRDAGIKVAGTTPSEAITGKRAGATYGRVLQQACLAAGLGSVSLGPLIRQGIELLNDPDLP